MAEPKKKFIIGIIGGTGMDDPDVLKNRRPKRILDTPYGKPSDELILGDINGIPCVLLARHGRKHEVEPSNINYRANIWALKSEGCTHIISTTACGSLKEEIQPGHMVILDSFIDRTQSRKHTFYDGQPGHLNGICHLQIEPPFNNQLRNILISKAEELDICVHKNGTVVTIEGPRFSTLAESNMHRQWGADIVNMTAVPEVILAKELGICYATIALVTDYDCWKKSDTVSATRVIQTFQENIKKICNLIVETIITINEQDWTESLALLDETIKNSILM